MRNGNQTSFYMRRVVVTGLGLVTPLGVGVKHVWRNLIAARCGIQSLDGRSEYDGLPSRVAGLVPRGSKSEGGWDPKDWLAAGVRLEEFKAKYPSYVEKSIVGRKAHVAFHTIRNCSSQASID